MLSPGAELAGLRTRMNHQSWVRFGHCTDIQMRQCRSLLTAVRLLQLPRSRRPLSWTGPRRSPRRACAAPAGRVSPGPRLLTAPSASLKDHILRMCMQTLHFILRDSNILISGVYASLGKKKTGSPPAAPYSALPLLSMISGTPRRQLASSTLAQAFSSTNTLVIN